MFGTFILNSHCQLKGNNFLQNHITKYDANLHGKIN